VDGAQAVPHKKIDVKKLGCDFYAFSGHKMLGPTGIGVLYGKRELLERMPPFMTGGDMIRSVSYQDATWNDLPMKFEAGTPNISGAIGLAEAIRYLQKVGMEDILSWEKTLLKEAIRQLTGSRNVFLYSPGVEKSAGVLSFNLQGVHSHDVASILNEENICIRAGHHCAMPLMNKLGIAGTSRASFYLYTTLEDVKKLVAGIERAQEVFK
ncbi:MAG: aminotransferase class V-fold PLP-dependent enzyme, partial [Nanoarchaeota archaeon]|nr:aminotransferase class V-fold PLP-dependent enzyme [Nanoarchaeota archaeon]